MMWRNRFLFVFVAIGLFVTCARVPVFAQATVERPQLRTPIVVQLDGIPTGALVSMLLRDIMRVPYVLAPDVLADRRPMSVRLVIPRDKVPENVVGFLRRNGLSVQLGGGTVYVGRKGHAFSAGIATAAQPGLFVSPDTNSSFPDVNSPSGSPLSGRVLQNPSPQDVGVSPAAGAATSSGPGPDPEPSELLGYIPAHRDPSYLSSVIGAVIPGLVFGARAEVQADTNGPQILSRDGPDVLVMSGSVADLERARKLIALLDRARPLVAVKAVVMQVQNVQTRGSALSVLASIDVGGGKLQIGSFPGAPTASQFIRLASGAFSAMLSAVREDSRFKVVASPNLSALSGAVATINAGSQVPTIGSVAVSDGTAVQSVVYRDSGITLTVRPVVRGDMIELDVREERSTFVRTTTGVEDSPTLQKSSASAQVVLKSGESVVLAGLTEQSDGNRREGIFGGLLGIRGRDKSDSELLVLLQAELVALPDNRAGQFVPLSDPEPAQSVQEAA